MREVSGREPDACADCGKLLGPGEGRASQAGLLCARCDAERRPVLTLQSRDLVLGILLGICCGCAALPVLLGRTRRAKSLTIGVFAGTLIQIMSVLLGVAVAYSLWW